MTPERWQRIEAAFNGAVELSPEQRRAHLEAFCNGDADLRNEVEALLEASAVVPADIHIAIAGEAERVVHTAAEDAWIGRHFGPWKINGFVGQGGMGAVYRATRDDKQYEQQVAIKVLRLGVNSAADLDRFRRERRILGRLEHPNIARLLDGGETRATGGAAESPYIVMEYVDGTPITTYARDHKAGTRERLRLFLQVLEAVAYAHQRLVLHRDLKPENILVTHFGAAKLLDFGIAKLIETGDDVETLTLLPALTPEYASPEQVRGEPLSAATDVYSLGAVLYELMSERRPYRFRKTDALETTRVICEVDPAPLGIDADLDTIVAKAMQKDPSRRYSSVEQFRDDIRRYLSGLPVLAQKDTRAYRLRKFVKRNGWRVAAGAAFVVTLLAGIAGTTYEAQRANRQVDDLRKLAGTLLFQVHDAIESLPGSMKARELLVKTSAAHLDRLASDAGSNTSFLLDVAGSYERLARLQGGPDIAHAGRIEDSIAAYKKALAVYGRIRGADAKSEDVLLKTSNCWYLLGRVYLSQGDATGATESFEHAVISAEQAARNGSIPKELQQAYNATGDLLLDSGEPANAMRYYQRTLKGLESMASAKRGLANDPRFIRSQALTTTRIGQAQEFLGDLAGAQATYASTLDTARRLVQMDPANVSYKRDVVVFTDRLATVTGHPDYPNAGDRKKAADLYEQMTAQATALAAADPQNTRAVRDLAEAHGNLADCLLGSDPARAINEYKAALATFSQLPQTMLSAARVIRTHALRERGLGLALERTGDHKAAMELIAAALHDFEKLAADQDVEGKQDVGNTRRVLAEVEAQSDPGAARRDFGQAVSNLEIAFHAHPKDIGIRTNLSNAYRALGEFLARTGEDCSESAVWNDKAKALWRELSIQPEVSRYAHDRLSALASYSDCTSR